MISRISRHKYVPAPSHEWLMLATIFLLMLLNFLQTGMVVFAAVPLMGELGVSPQEYSLVTAAYACVAVVTISKQRWLVERLGWKYYMLGSILVFCIGCLVGYNCSSFDGFLTAYVIMGFCGASFMTGARLIINLFPPSPLRLTGIKAYAYGLTIGMSLAPFLAAHLFLASSWHGLFIVLLLVALLAAITASFCLPGVPPKSETRSQSHPYFLMALAAGSFLLLYGFQHGNYAFFSNTLLVCVFLLLGLSSLYYCLRSMVRHHDNNPLLSMKSIFGSPLYRKGVLLFFVCYLIMGSNGYLIPQILSKGLGLGWGTIGNWYALGQAFSVVALTLVMLVFPKKPHGKKFYVFGFLLLALYGFLMTRLSPNTSVQTYIVPALCVFMFFTVAVQGTVAAKAFNELQHDETVFSHAQQVKNMLSQLSMALGISLASIGLQWRSTVHYSVLNQHVASHDPVFVSTLQQIVSAYGPQVSTDVANKAGMAWIVQQVQQNAVLLSGIDYFSLLLVVGIVGAIVMARQKSLN
ncbi:MFS transporter [Marinomonas sp.]|uniref:MFS transporter n=1 Tax=Marinomonas sp. TaxID=1904862 RepID=UPI003BA8EDF6